MQIQYVRYFLAICEARSFIRAARQCGVAQPSLSDAIKRLEHLVGGSLFVRARPPQFETLPTPLALAIKPHLEQALESLERATQVAASLYSPTVRSYAQSNPDLVSSPDLEPV